MLKMLFYSASPTTGHAFFRPTSFFHKTHKKAPICGTASCALKREQWRPIVDG
jgi:hypothetical protein